LLEVLDPEQNSTFRDHYLGVAYDLSRVMWITTANLLDTIQPAFLDRMEVIRLSGYALEEKLAIARRHLVPKQLAEHGLTPEQLAFTDKALRRVVDEWTREAGLRNLEREIAAICRKTAVRVATGSTRRFAVGPRKLESLLGQPRFYSEDLLARDRVGVATGLAWTATGGELTFVEAAATPGKGELSVTGQLGDVMKESARAAWTYCRTWAARSGQPADFFSQNDLHLHMPAGAIPKDGPSAGITMAVAILSLLTGRKIDRRLAMTGEITLRGDVLPIGGLKEKLLAARAAGIRTVLLPRANRRDLAELPATLRHDVELVTVERMDEVVERALLPAGRAAGRVAPLAAGRRLPGAR
ncbi:MAG: endopeptidase La, partial [Thermoanaerobaculia bacterium]|nr:endopeptidase La [Thermoanaerobaculia bacterium]